MLNVTAAQSAVLNFARALPAAKTALANALGLVLAEEITSDLDMPPFDKAMMDGYAVRAADLPSGTGTLTVVEEITAGKTPARPIGPGQAARIMTGAPIPHGADAVVQVERTKQIGDLHGGESTERVGINDPGIKAGKNILERGKEMRAGEVVVARGALIRPQEMGVLASVGRDNVLAVPRPAVAIIPTGDEIVEVGRTPGPGQIRNSNGSTLAGLAARAGGVPRYLGIATDEIDSLRGLIDLGLREDVLVLCGGVSAGRLDLVPGVLQELGVEPHFHKVEMKPGKPVFFGTRGKTLVFGLPGNPVSSFVCFELFVRPALRILRGFLDAGTELPTSALAEDFAYRTDRPTFHPAWMDATKPNESVKVVPWFGSPDLRGLLHCNCFVLLEPGDHRYLAGQRLPVLRMENIDS